MESRASPETARGYAGLERRTESRGKARATSLAGRPSPATAPVQGAVPLRGVQPSHEQAPSRRGVLMRTARQEPPPPSP
jgi:hypothetical protein